MILADTSVWVHHLRRGDNDLVELLHSGLAACHPFVLGELACGGIRNRKDFLGWLATLPALPKADDAEVLDFIDRHHLMNLGLGLIDVHLLASCRLAGAALWTTDKTLATAASRLDLSWAPRSD